MKTLVAAGVVLALSGGIAPAADTEALAEEGKALIQQFGGALKKELMAAVEAGGPVNAIGVCHERAPGIAAEISGASGWSVARSSHKLRNPDNAPDAFTAAAIAEFLDRQAAGESAEAMAKAAVIEEEGGRVFHLVKAIPTGELCLNCHGSAEVSAEVEAKLAELYPADMARGFSAGEMRGVFTLKKPLD